MRRRREAEARAVRLSAEEAARLAALSVAEVETERLLKEAEEEAERHRLYLISLLAKETKPDTPEKPMTPQPLMQFGDAFKRDKALRRKLRPPGVPARKRSCDCAQKSDAS